MHQDNHHTEHQAEHHDQDKRKDNHHDQDKRKRKEKHHTWL